MISKLFNKLKAAFDRKPQPQEKPISRVMFVDADGVSKNAEVVVLQTMKSFDKTYIVKTVGQFAQKSERERLEMLYGQTAEIILFDAVGKEAVDKIIAMKMSWHMAKGVKQFALMSHDGDFVDVSFFARTMCPEANTTMIIINDGNKEKIKSLVKKCRQRDQNFVMIGLKQTISKMGKRVKITHSVKDGKFSKASLEKILAICQPMVDDKGTLSKAHFRWLMKHHGIFTSERGPDDVYKALTNNGLAHCHAKSSIVQFPQFAK